MSSIFFQISRTDFIEASKIYGVTDKEFGVRLVSFKSGIPVYAYLPQMSLNELGVLVSLLKATMVTNIGYFDDLQKYYFNVIYYY